MEQKLEFKQIQTISQRVIQTNRILQLTSKQLDEYILEESETNPVIEIIEDPEYSGYSRRKQAESTPDDYLSDDDDRESLRDYLLGQITTPFSDNEQWLLEYLVDSLDDNGYLKEDPAEIAEQTGMKPAMVQKMITLIQSLEPAGVGAGDMKECLLIQLRRRGNEDKKLERFIREGLDLYAQGKIGQLQNLLSISREEIQEYISQIRELNPRPGAGFSHGEKTTYLIPDIYIEKTEKGFEIIFNPHLYHQIRVSEEYRQLYKSMPKEEKQYLRERIQRANFLQHSIIQRETMITSLARLILGKQEEFFRNPEGGLHSLRMQDAADELHVHVSTISRTVRGKYLQCERGIFPLKYFFVQGISDDQPVRTDIRQIIAGIVAEENKKKPLSDQKITEQLLSQGIRISRRTVAKYRTELGIPDKSKRVRF